MEQRSPTTPIPGAEPQLRDLQSLRREEITRIDKAQHGVIPHDHTRDRSAATALTIGAAAFGADILVRPLLAPDLLRHPVVQTIAMGALLATAFGVLRGWRPARRAARGIGYIVGAASFFALSRFASLAGPAEWWTAGLWAVEAVSLGYMLQRLGWAGDEE